MTEPCYICGEPAIGYDRDGLPECEICWDGEQNWTSAKRRK